MGNLIGEPKFERIIKYMYPGESGYTVPWAMSIDECGRVWLNLAYTIKSNPSGNVEMKVTRTGVGKTDYDVDIRGFDHKFSLGKGNYVGTDEKDVVHITTLSKFGTLTEKKKVY